MRLCLHTRRRLTGTPYSSFTYQRNPSDPTINPSPMSTGCIFFIRARTICCLKLAFAFDTRVNLSPFYPSWVSHQPSTGIELPRSNTVGFVAYLSVDFIFDVTTVYTTNYLSVIPVIRFQYLVAELFSSFYVTAFGF